MQRLIDSLALPTGLRDLDSEQLNQVAQELRDELIDSISNSGGHFASSLGATELTVALHAVFDTPHDRLVWDVGHQAYIHKMLTGRRSEMPGIRKKSGISGFLKRSESEYDSFGAGHAGTSISAAVGMAQALKSQGSDRHVVAVIGDGSITAGMALEALNHAGDLQLGNLIVVLNDNEMSISPNVGAMSWLFSRAVTSSLSTKARSKFKELHKRGYIPDLVYEAFDRAEEATQGWFSGAAQLFESFGFRYIGPIDGHNLDDLLLALKNAREQDIPVLVHASTVKGKGYNPAEEDPLTWHGVQPFHRERGEFVKKGSAVALPPTYTQVFANTLVRLRDQNSAIVGITAAMASGTGLDYFAEKHPESYIDVGICEQHAVTFAAGLACEGQRPVCAIYSTFLQRAFDQIVHDVCIQELPVIFAMDRAGVVGNDGETHQGVFDIAYLRSLPNMVIMSPKDENELQHMLYTASILPGPSAIRYPRGNGAGVELDTEFEALPVGRAELIQTGKDVLFVCLGPLVQYALKASARLEQEYGLKVGIINARFAKPLDHELLAAQLPLYTQVCTWEDHAIIGGFGSAISELIQDQQIQMQQPLMRFGIKDEFVPHATQNEQHELNACDPQSVVTELVKQLGLTTTQKIVGF